MCSQERKLVSQCRGRKGISTADCASIQGEKGNGKRSVQCVCQRNKGRGRRGKLQDEESSDGLSSTFR